MVLDDDFGLAGHLDVVWGVGDFVWSGDGWHLGLLNGLIRILSHRDIGGTTANMILFDQRINLWLSLSLDLGIMA